MSEDVFDAWLSALDLDFWGTGRHKITLEQLLSALEQGDAPLVLDVRTDEERRYWALPFALAIPLHELPARWQELPHERLIAAFCPGKIRASVAYAYLQSKGLDNVRILDARATELVEAFKPGPVRKLAKA